ncbi:hypothetical protein [Nocardia sp. NPDC052566]|uniref:hypothetical protein n=1 Tax=Nocardia sp. NPDC052566 TaxID=3364330 RepID=UPI0037CAFDE0
MLVAISLLCILSLTAVFSSIPERRRAAERVLMILWRPTSGIVRPRLARNAEPPEATEDVKQPDRENP